MVTKTLNAVVAALTITLYGTSVAPTASQPPVPDAEAIFGRARDTWLITYQDYRGCRIIDRELALDALDFGPKRTYEKTTIYFDIIADPAAYRLPIVKFKRSQGDDDLVEPGD